MVFKDNIGYERQKIQSRLKSSEIKRKEAVI